MLIRICDRCREQIAEERVEFSTRMIEKNEDKLESLKFVKIAEFCPACAEEIQVFMNCNIRVKKEEEKAEEVSTVENKAVKKEEKKQSRGRKRVDTGKICALYQTGEWSAAKIALECDCSEYTVKEKLKEAGLWGYKNQNKERKAWEWT